MLQQFFQKVMWRDNTKILNMICFDCSIKMLGDPFHECVMDPPFKVAAWCRYIMAVTQTSSLMQE